MSDIQVRKFGELSPDEAEMLERDVAEAERGYSMAQLDAGEKRMRGRPLSVGDSPAVKVLRVRIDQERDAKLSKYMSEHHLTQSAAVRDLLDKALAEF